MDNLNLSLEKSLHRRRQMADTLSQAFRAAPQEMHTLLKTLAVLYQSGNIPRFWDILAILGGAERGFGNSWFFTALELERQNEQK